MRLHDTDSLTGGMNDVYEVQGTMAVYCEMHIVA